MRKSLKKAKVRLGTDVVNLPLYGGLRTAWTLDEEDGQFIAESLGDALRDLLLVEMDVKQLAEAQHGEELDRFRQDDLIGRREWYLVEWGEDWLLCMTPSVFEKASVYQREDPLFVGKENEPERKLWWYSDDFWESRGYSDEEVKLLLWEKARREERKFERLAKAKSATEQAVEQARRQRIPEEVRLLVWERDGGRCVKCGSTEELEFDHIIPVSKGGSNTEKNVQLLCARCNLEKGDRIA